MPLIVVGELDKRKHDSKPLVRRRGGTVLRQLDDLFGTNGDPFGQAPTLRGAQCDEDSPVSKGPVTVMLVKDHGVPAGSTADEEIVASALALQAVAGRTVTILTFDNRMAFTARGEGLAVIKFDTDQFHPDVAPKAKPQ
jgi:predicted ribonuclease YlaK